MTKHTMAVIAHIGAAIIFCAIGVLGSVKLIEISLVGETTFFALIVLSVVASLLIAFFWSLKDFTISGGSLKATLREAKDVEAHMKTLAAATLEMVESDEGGYKQPTWDAARYEKAKENLRKLVG